MTYRSLYDWFHSSAEKFPDNVAVEAGQDTLTYAQLQAAVERLSAAIHQVHGGAPRRVGLLSSRHLAGYLAYLAILRLGATVVPLNPAYPVARNVAITTEAALDLTVIDDSGGVGADEYRESAGVAILDLLGDTWRTYLRDDPSLQVPDIVEPDLNDASYLIFTSGTTGRPKGVPVTHVNVSSFLDEVMKRYKFTPRSRAAQTFEMCFDGSVLAMFGAWGSGAALCVAERGDVLAPVKFITSRRLTHWLSVPSLILFADRLRALHPGSMPTLELSSFGGEPLTVEHIKAWTTAAPNTAVINCYGPSECACIVTAYEIPAGQQAKIATSNGSAPIGTVFDHLEYLLLDKDLRPATDDGELCVRGDQRFPGYLDPADNAGRFVAYDGETVTPYDGSEPLTDKHWYRTGDRVSREAGELVHQGRVDHQVKVMGNRVELGEIERALRQHPGIVEAVVVTIPGADGAADLHAFYTGERLDDDELAKLVGDLPVYMHPQMYHHGEEMPLNEVDKIDRKRLVEEYLSTTT